MPLTVKKPTQFYVEVEPTEVFEIYDTEGNLYYFGYPGDDNRLRINIPHKGEYVANVNSNIISERTIPIPPMPKLDKPTRNRWKKTEIIYDSSLKDTPACIFTDNGKIIVGDLFLSMPKQIQEFLEWHEKGHFLYVDEESCDKFALAACLKKGNNRSMCFYALKNYLSRSEENIERMNTLLDSIQETQKQPLIWT